MASKRKPGRPCAAMPRRWVPAPHQASSCGPHRGPGSPDSPHRASSLTVGLSSGASSFDPPLQPLPVLPGELAARDGRRAQQRLEGRPKVFEYTLDRPQDVGRHIVGFVALLPIVDVSRRRETGMDLLAVAELVGGDAAPLGSVATGLRELAIEVIVVWLVVEGRLVDGLRERGG